MKNTERGPRNQKGNSVENPCKGINIINENEDKIILQLPTMQRDQQNQ